ncbi:transcriptional regulator [Halorubrum sp. ARQ200]|uniref:transcriptional regulator n=1 Tax=Halorubrum sp. ARQ200 TaxID=1855872 RepID=UPI0010FA469D|nr:transcriptional regulator [Halorubrum sp. ARQ200]TKX45167.1 transcriptional regulator [Halorubrum sp. ARQ200]
MDDRDEEGKFNQQYSDEEFLSAIGSLSIASTQSVADEVGCSYDLAYRRLHDLKNKEKIDYEVVGQAFIWSIR